MDTIASSDGVRKVCCPDGYDKVKIGQPISIVEKVFAPPPKKKEDGFITLDVEHPFFGNAVYYYSDEAPQNIYQVMYMNMLLERESIKIIFRSS